ncbi:MAG TPA: DUF5693 family protein [Bacillota bacterium]|nr:DUF5693 family protein [Bacillota bacterium]HOO29446.1 DUF5693 family protein [Bacillota bacterium]HPQ02534.1 DUF5693 family protein [Bacillota bacterium]
MGHRKPRSIGWLIALIVLASVSSAWIAWQRNRVEKANSVVELCMDYSEIALYSRRVGINIEDCLRGLAEEGIVSVALEEDTLGSMETAGEIVIIRGSEALALGSNGSPYRDILLAVAEMEVFSPSDTIVIPCNVDAATFLANRLTLRTCDGPSISVIRAGDATGYAVSLPVDEARKLNLGIRPSKTAQVQAAGLRVVVRFSNFPNVSEKWIDSVMTLSAVGAIPDCVIFAGTEVLGYPRFVSATVCGLDRLGTVYGDIEFQNQAGGRQLARALDYKTVRVHSISRAEVDRDLSVAAMRDRYARAVRERNIRVLYMRPMMKPIDERSLPEVNQSLVAEVVSAITDQGFSLGPAAPFDQLDPGLLLTLLVVLGVAAGCVVLLDAIWDLPFAICIGLVAVFAAGFAALWGLGYPLLARQSVALAAAIAFPSLAAFVLFCPDIPGKTRDCDTCDDGALLANKDWLGSSGTKFLTASMLCLAGGLMLAACLTSRAFMVKGEQFLGVKAMHIFPMLFVLVAYWKRYARRGNESLIASLARLNRSNILVWHVIVIAILGVAGLIYIARTGNTSSVPVAVPQWEQKMRAALENIFPARPRTKEFLIGHPAFVLAGALVALGETGLLLPISILGLIGQISLTNTFAHIHTPISLTLARVIIGLGLGFAIGLVATVVYRAVVAQIRRAAGREG